MLHRLCRKIIEREVMKKYRVLITGNLYFTTDSEDKAIEYAEEKINQLHNSYNMSIFSIAEVREE